MAYYIMSLLSLLLGPFWTCARGAESTLDSDFSAGVGIKIQKAKASPPSSSSYSHFVNTGTGGGSIKLTQDEAFDAMDAIFKLLGMPPCDRNKHRLPEDASINFMEQEAPDIRVASANADDESRGWWLTHSLADPKWRPEQTRSKAAVMEQYGTILAKFMAHFGDNMKVFN